MTLDLAQLDRTYESLDRVEDHFGLVLDGKVKEPKAKAKKRVVVHVGETIVAQTGHANGALAEHAVAYYEQWRLSGLLRDRVEKDDVALQRKHLAELAADIDATNALLRRHVKELTGNGPAAIDTVAALAKLDDAIVRLRKADRPRELRRGIHRALVVVIGGLMQAELGPAEWRVENAPRDVDLGCWCIFGKCLTNTVERAKSAEDLVRVVGKMIESVRAKGR